MNNTELSNNFYIACFHYAKTIGPDPTITDTDDFVYLSCSSDNVISIAQWNHASPQPTNTMLKNYSVQTVLDTWNTYLKQNTDSYRINENGSFNLTFSGPWSSNKTLSFKYIINENTVVINIPTISYTSNSNASPIISTTAMKISLRPSNILSFPIIVENNGTKQFGSLQINSNGYLVFYTDPNKNSFYGNVSGNSGFEATSVSYAI